MVACFLYNHRTEWIGSRWGIFFPILNCPENGIWYHVIFSLSSLLILFFSESIFDFIIFHRKGAKEIDVCLKSFEIVWNCLNSQTLKLSNSQTLKLSNPQTLKLSNSRFFLLSKFFVIDMIKNNCFLWYSRWLSGELL